MRIISQNGVSDTPNCQCAVHTHYYVTFEITQPLHCAPQNWMDLYSNGQSSPKIEECFFLNIWFWHVQLIWWMILVEEILTLRNLTEFWGLCHPIYRVYRLYGNLLDSHPSFLWRISSICSDLDHIIQILIVFIYRNGTEQIRNIPEVCNYRNALFRTRTCMYQSS